MKQLPGHDPSSWRLAKHSLRSAFERLDRSARRLLLQAGLPARRPYLVLNCGAGDTASGLFSEFCAVLGMLDHLEKWGQIYAGALVDFADQGLYYDAEHGSNWWEYYFQRIALGREAGGTPTIVSQRQHDIFASGIARLPRARGAELIARHIRPKPHLLAEVDAYVRKHFRDAHVIGVHYRGTDKHEEAPRVPYERVQAAVAEALRAAGSRPHKLFVATDEQAFLDFMRERFREGLLYRETPRSVDGKPMHFGGDNNHAKGQDAVLDCLLLSRCKLMIRTPSNLGLCASLINPRVAQLELGADR